MLSNLAIFPTLQDFRSSAQLSRPRVRDCFEDHPLRNHHHKDTRSEIHRCRQADLKGDAILKSIRAFCQGKNTFYQ
jgi:hypothetical protein